MRIAVDAFGGDNAPLEIIKGAALASREYSVDITLTGLSIARTGNIPPIAPGCPRPAHNHRARRWHHGNIRWILPLRAMKRP